MYDVVNNSSGIWQSLPWLYLLYTKIMCIFQLIVFQHQKKQCNCHHKLDPECTDAFWGGEHPMIPSRAYFTEHLYMIRIYQVYVCHIHSAGLFLFDCTRPALPGLISAAGRFTYQNSIDSRLRPAKVPHPGVDLKNMAAPACSLACTVSTPEFKGLLLSYIYDVAFIICDNPLIIL